MHLPGDASSPVFSSLTENRLMYLTYKPITAIPPAAAILFFRLLCAKIFLHMRQNLLDSLRPAVALPPSATVSVQAVQQCRQREQIRDTERRPARRHPHKRIHRRSTGKSLTNAAQHSVITRVMDPSHTLHRPDLDQLELASVKRMKQVRHTEVAPEPPALRSTAGTKALFRLRRTIPERGAMSSVHPPVLGAFGRVSRFADPATAIHGHRDCHRSRSRHMGKPG